MSVPQVGRHPSLASLMPERGLVRTEPGPEDRWTFWEGQLDRVSEAVFGGAEGAARAAPLLAQVRRIFEKHGKPLRGGPGPASAGGRVLVAMYSARVPAARAALGDS